MHTCVEQGWQEESSIHLEAEAASVLNQPAVLIGTLVGGLSEELLDQVAIGGVHLHSIKPCTGEHFLQLGAKKEGSAQVNRKHACRKCVKGTCFNGILGSICVVLDDRCDLLLGESLGHRVRAHAAISAHAVLLSWDGHC